MAKKATDAAFAEESKAAEQPERVTRRPFAVWEVGGESYRLRLATSDIVELEKRYGQNLLDVMATDSDTGLPALAVMLDVTQQAMQKYHHGMTRAKVMELFDQYVEEGGSQYDFYVSVFTDIFVVSGFFSRARVEKMESALGALNDEQ